MKNLAAWEKQNDEYLAAALAWLRLKLAKLTPDEAPVPRAQARRCAWFPFRSWEVRDEPATTPALSRVTDDEVRSAEDAMNRAAATTPEPALVWLGKRLELSTFEQNVLLLCAGMELDTGIAGMCARAQGNPARAYPTFALALSVFDDPAWEALSAERPLRYWKLIDANQMGSQPLTTCPLRADERVVNYIKGLNELDDRLSPLVALVREGAADLAPTQAMQAQTIGARVRGMGREVPLVHLLGSDSGSKRAIAGAVAAQLGLGLYRLRADALPATLSEAEAHARLWEREVLLAPVALFLEIQDAEREAVAANRFLIRGRGLVFLDTRDPWPELGREAMTIDSVKPTMEEQAQAWSRALDDESPEVSLAAWRMASQFHLNLADIERIVRTAAIADGPLEERFWNGCLLATRPRLDSLAQRLEPKEQEWDDLILADAEKRSLRQIVDQVWRRHTVYELGGFARRTSRGLGISVLFAGESGTGKTMAAEVMARELKLNLYRIDLSQVMSKYIGDTPKSLRKLFDAAEDGGTILFFDEADAIFGKRSEVKDSHDRYANIEINYLLQRMEAYRGLAILATNMKSALDAAFLRRLRCIVNFSFPGVADRRRIWERAFPKETRTSGLDFERLARFHFTGGSIQNVAMNAAFLAARNGSPVDMGHVLDAARTEFRKLDKPVNEAEFRWVQPVGVGA